MDIEIVLEVTIAVVLVALFIYLRRTRLKVMPVSRGDYYAPPVLRVPSPRYDPGVTIVETNSGFSEGLLVGSMMNAGRNETIVSETVVVNEITSDPPAFSGFGGGDSAGGGASSDWCSSDSSGDSSSCVSGSYDSGSSSDGDS